MSYGKMNSHIDIITTAPVKDDEGFVSTGVSAFFSDVGISIGQVKVEEKSSEYTAIPELLDLIDIKGCTITIDAKMSKAHLRNIYANSREDSIKRRRFCAESQREPA